LLCGEYTGVLMCCPIKLEGTVPKYLIRIDNKKGS